MKNNYLLGLVSAVAFLFSAISIGLAFGQGRNITEVEGGLFAATVAIIMLAIRLYSDEKRLSALEKLVAEDNSGDKCKKDDMADENSSSDTDN